MRVFLMMMMRGSVFFGGLGLRKRKRDSDLEDEEDSVCL